MLNTPKLTENESTIDSSLSLPQSESPDPGQ
jgi:hypothetical protein